ncbi:retrovirus-related pol polyprotein from transposon TNT 1-94 [Tanacetum coccineum]
MRNVIMVINIANPKGTSRKLQSESLVRMRSHMILHDPSKQICPDGEDPETLEKKIKECECLAQKLSKQTESVNKEVHNNLLKSFAKLEKHSISLELSLQHCKEQMKNNPVCKENASNVFRKEREQYHEIQDLKAQMQDKNMVINELKKLILVTKGKSVETQFDKPSVVRQPNAQRIPKPSVLGKPTPFSNSPEMRCFQTKQSVNKTNVSDGLFKPVTQQNLPQKRNQAVRNTNVLKPGMYRIASTTTQTRTPQLPHASRNTNPHMSKSSGVIHTTSVSRPQLKSYQVKDKVVPNISQVKFTKKEVEDHHRISSISKKTKSVTACNDSSNSRTSNVNAVCAECGKCVFNSNHDACVSRYLKDVNARTKKPHVVPISASKPKRKANKSVATPHKKTVASDTTIQKSKSYYKKLYEDTNQEWKWWIAKRCPSGYTWTQKPLRTKKIWMPKIRKDNVSSNISPTIDIVSRITNVLKISNFIGSNLSNIPSSSNSLADCTTHPIHYLQGNDLLIGNRGSDLYTISLQETTSSTPICLMAKASPTQAWLWHRRLYHLNFEYINFLSKKDVVIGLPKIKYVKDQLCSSCEVSIAKRSSFKTKTVPSSKGRLNLLHMDLCGPMRVASINGKKYILVIVDEYSRYTWTLFLRSKDETPEVLNDFITMIQRNLQAPVISVRTERDKMEEKGDLCILVGYSTQSKGYRVYKQRTRLIVESIHLRFDEIKEMSKMSVANDTSGLVPQRQKVSDYDNSDPNPQLQNVSPSVDTTVPLQQELKFLFGHLYDEFFNTGTSRVYKSSSPNDNSIPQDTHPSTNIQPT